MTDEKESTDDEDLNLSGGMSEGERDSTDDRFGFLLDDLSSGKQRKIESFSTVD